MGQAPGGDFPHLAFAVGGSGTDPSAIGAELTVGILGPKRRLITHRGGHRLARPEIPHPHFFVRGGAYGQRQGTVGADPGHDALPGGILLQPGHLPPGRGQRPGLRRSLLRGDDHDLTVGRRNIGRDRLGKRESAGGFLPRDRVEIFEAGFPHAAQRGGAVRIPLGAQLRVLARQHEGTGRTRLDPVPANATVIHHLGQL